MQGSISAVYTTLAYLTFEWLFLFLILLCTCVRKANYKWRKKDSWLFLFHGFWDLSFLILSATGIKKNLVCLLPVFALCVCKSSKGLYKFRDISTCKSCLPGEFQMCLKSSWKAFLGWYFFQRWHSWTACNFFPSSVVSISDFDNAMAHDCDLEIIVHSTLQISLPPFND